MKYAIIVTCVLACFGAGNVAAESHHVLVLRADGNADTATRAKVDAQVLKLAKAAEGAAVEAGEISFTDAATAVGCSGTEAQCRDDVLSTMGVDEVISINVTAMPSGDIRIIVHRIPKSGPIRDAQTIVPGGQPVDTKIAGDIGPMFGVTAPSPSPPPPARVTPPPPPPPPPAGTSAPLPAFGDPNHTATPPRTAQGQPPVDANNTVTAAPNGQVTTTPEGRTSNRPLAGFAISGGMALLAIIMWAEASSTQGDINTAPTRSPADFRHLQDLESKGDTYATLGNLFFIGGLVVGGVSGYYFWKDHRTQSSAQARLAPTVFDHGAGIALTIGGAP